MQIFYTVRLGDTLSAIARRWNIPPNSLILANNIASPDAIFPGQQLSMPPGTDTYVVKQGDTIFSISQFYGIPMSIIIDANVIPPPYLIVPGQVLVIPRGVAYYVVRPGDTLYNIALRYNLVVDGIVRPDLIINANSGLTPDIFPGMQIAVPYPPPGGRGQLAVLLSDGFNNFIQLYDPATGAVSYIRINEADRASTIFWSPDRRYIALVQGNGIISVIEVSSQRISRIDQSVLPAFVDWSHDSRKLVYSNGNIIRIYDVAENTFRTLNRQGASYVQWFPGDTELLFEARDGSGLSQLFRIRADGSNERKITVNTGGPLNDVRLSPNGRYVLYTSPGVSISEIYTFELSSGTVAKIPGGPEAKNYYPVWSPDSTKIAYSATSFINGKYYSLIRVSGVKGENDTTLAISSCFATPVTWSQDSRRIAWLSACREDFPPVEVWSLDIAKPVPLNIIFGFFFYSLDWA